MGLAFKENCPDIRNTKVVDIISELTSYDINVDAFDPWVNASDTSQLVHTKLINLIDR